MLKITEISTNSIEVVNNGKTYKYQSRSLQEATGVLLLPYLKCIAYGEAAVAAFAACNLEDKDELNSVFHELVSAKPELKPFDLLYPRKDMFTLIKTKKDSTEYEHGAMLDQIYAYIGWNYLYGNFTSIVKDLVAALKLGYANMPQPRIPHNTEHNLYFKCGIEPYNDLTNLVGYTVGLDEEVPCPITRALRANIVASSAKLLDVVLDIPKVGVYYRYTAGKYKNPEVVVTDGTTYLHYKTKVVALVTSPDFEEDKQLTANGLILQALGELLAYSQDALDLVEQFNVEDYKFVKDTKAMAYRNLAFNKGLNTAVPEAYLDIKMTSRSSQFINSSFDLTGFKLVAGTQCKPSLGVAGIEPDAEALVVDTTIMEELTPERKRIAELEAELAKLKGGNKLVSGGLVYAMKGKIHIGSDSFPVEKGRPAIAYIGLKLLELRATVDIPIESLYVKGSNFASGTTAYGNYGIPAWDASFKDGNERKPFKEIMRIYKFVSIDTMLTDLREYLAGDFNVSEYAVNRAGLAIYLAMLVGSNSFNKLEALGFSKADYEAYNRFLAGYKACI